MKIWSIIPARAGSKRIPKKNIKPLAGEPLMAYTIAVSLKSKYITRTIVSTDSSEIVEISHKYGAEVPFIRPAEISGDLSNDTGFMGHCINWFERNEGEVCDLFVFLRPTTPLRKVATVDRAVELFTYSPERTALRSVHMMEETAYKRLEIGEDNGALVTIFQHDTNIDKGNKPSQLYPKTYQCNGYVDVLRVEYFKQHHCLYGDNVLPYVTEEATEADTPECFEYLEFQLSRKKDEYAFFDN